MMTPAEQMAEIAKLTVKCLCLTEALCAGCLEHSIELGVEPHLAPHGDYCSRCKDGQVPKYPQVRVACEGMWIGYDQFGEHIRLQEAVHDRRCCGGILYTVSQRLEDWLEASQGTVGPDKRFPWWARVPSKKRSNGEWEFAYGNGDTPRNALVAAMF